MPALNERDLKKNPAYLYVAPIPDGFDKTTPLKDGSNANVVFSEIDAAVVAASDWQRLGSIIDLGYNKDFSANRVEVTADECDTGTICLLVEPDVNVTVTWYECSNPDVVSILTGVPSLADGNDVYTAFVKECIDLPRFIVKIVTCNDPQDEIILYDASLNGSLSASFVDVKRAGGLNGSELTFDLNKAGCVIEKLTDYLP